LARIRHIEIRNFRSIQSLQWSPELGINCLIGPGDSGKSTIIEAIDACLTPRRSLSFADSDFHALNVQQPIQITVTLGNLPDELKDVDLYGDFLRGFDPIIDVIDEPGNGFETVLSIRLTVGADLEPSWRLYSDRTADDESTRLLPWKTRIELAPLRLGGHPNSNLSWARGSVLNKLSDERADMHAELVSAAREARSKFGDAASAQLAETLKTVTDTANDLGIPIGREAKALLDVHAVSFAEGSVSLHADTGIPLRNLGLGSNRLLLAGLHRKAAGRASVVLADEVEVGLEPHRLTRLLHSLGSKDAAPPLQVFMTTHSPVVVRELSGMQLHVLRRRDAEHRVLQVGTADEVQSTVRCDPEAFLAETVYVCEGASEIGLLRGLDLYFHQTLYAPSLFAKGAAFVNASGGSPDLCLRRALAIRGLGYKTVAFIDNDQPASPETVAALRQAGATLVTWRPGFALEDELFQTFPSDVVRDLIAWAVRTDKERVEQTLKKASAANPVTIEAIQAEFERTREFSLAHRAILGAAARARRQGWFKSISKMEEVARTILGPRWDSSESFKAVVTQLWQAVG
jgi:putative ATP-dependent endonuclease of OLD family